MNVNDIAKAVLKATSAKKETSPYYASARVMRVDQDGTAWVHIDGGVSETPAEMTMSAKAGDTVKIRVAGGRAWITGNVTSPPTDDSKANEATVLVNNVQTTVNLQQVALSYLEAEAAKIQNLTAESLEAAVAYIKSLRADEVSTDNIVAVKAYIDALVTNNVTATDLTAASGYIDKLSTNDVTTDKLTAASGYIDSLTSKNVTADNLVTASAYIEALGTKNITAEYIASDHATISNLDSNYAQIDLANVNNAWIEKGLIKDAAITDEKVLSVSANKLTAGTIDASDITVINLNAGNINAGKLTVDGITIDLDTKKADIDGGYIKDGTVTLAGLSSEVVDKIDGAIETFTSNEIPTLNNYPASGWTTDKERMTHVGDVCYVVNAGSSADGYCYRYTYTDNAFSWVLIKDSDVTSALQQLIDVQGNISGLQSFQTSTESWEKSTDDELSSLRTRTSSVETALDTKVDTTTFNKLSQTVDENSSTITKHTTLITTAQNTADKAVTNAATAQSTADNATTAAATAQSTADDANTAATAAQSTADSAVSAANTAQATADTAVTDAATAQSTANSASTAASKAQSTADTAVSNASKAQTTADTAVSDASKAQTTADTAVSNASKAQSTADDAVTAANEAQSTADTAVSNASKAQSTADTAVTNASKAQTTANTAATNASKAQSTADTAVTNAATAQSTADNAASAASSAQNTADTAVTNAATAQTAAETAQSAADGAQATADKASTETITVYYASSSTTAPAKPTAQVTSTNNSGGGWRLVKPDVSKSYPYLYHCVQNNTPNGYTWGTVYRDYVETTVTNTVNSVKQTADSNTSSISTLQTTVGKQGETISSHSTLISQNTSSISTEVSAREALAERVTSAESSISQNADNIELKVSKDGVISSINQSPESITIDADRVNISGAAIFKNYSTTEEMNNAISSASSNLEDDIEHSSIEYIVGTQTATTNAWTGVSKSASLYTGKTIGYKLPYAGTNSAATLNLTLADGTTTGAKTLRWNSGSSVTTHYGAGSVIIMTYDGTYWRISEYNGDTINRTRYQNLIKAYAAITAGRIICGTASGFQNIAAGISFNLSYPLLYAGTTLKASATGDNNYLQINGIKVTNNGTVTSAAQYAVVYLKGTVKGNIFTISASPFLTCVEPTSDDGYCYIPLGTFYNSTTNIYFNSSSQLYAYKDGLFGPVSIREASAASTAASAAQTTANTAVSNASKAQSTADTAVSNAAAAQSTADGAATAASNAQSTADTAVTNASKAQTTANTAVTNASKAQSTADTAVSDAATAQDTADTAVANAATAQTTADNAVSAASKAQSTADTAVKNAATAQSTANSANSQEQLIYKSAVSGTTTMSGTTSWVTASTDTQNSWTMVRPTYSSSYPVLFVATQRKSVAGTVTCTTPHIDYTTTVIDGGNVITSSITADKIAGNTLTLSKMASDVTGEISDASRVATDYLAFNASDGLSIGASTLNSKITLTSDGISIFDAKGSVSATYGSSIIIGNATKMHQELNSRAWKLYDYDNNIFASVMDLRDENGECLFPSTFTGDGTTTAFNGNSLWTSYDGVKSVTVDGTETSDYTLDGNTVTFNTAPESGTKIVITYISKDKRYKEYTFGLRKTNDDNGKFSIAIGDQVDANGAYTIALGYYATSSGICSTALGYSTTSNGFFSYCEGLTTTASGWASHAEGGGTVASGQYTHAGGFDTKVSGNHAFAHGYYLNAESDYQAVFGKYNASSDALFVIGNGTGDSNRSNAFTVDSSGNIESTGTIKGSQLKDTKIYYSTKGGSYIVAGDNDAANGVGGNLNNLVINSWYGVSFTTSCTGQTYTGKNAVSINCRTGNLMAASFNGYTLDLSTANSSDTWVPVLSGSKIQHRVLPSFLNNVGRTHLSSKTYVPFSSENLVTVNTLAFWNGAYNSSGSSNLTYCHAGTIVGTNTKVILVKEYTLDNLSLSKTSTKSFDFTISTPSGYNVAGIVQARIQNASSSGTNQETCLLNTFVPLSTTQARVSVRNVGSSAAKIKISIRVLYVLVGNYQYG